MLPTQLDSDERAAGWWAGLWSTIRDALKGMHVDYTDGPIGRAVLLLAIPMMLELILESVFAVVDVFFVSRLGADAIATVGLTESMITIMYAVASGLSIGATAVIARRTGEHDSDGAARAAVQAILLGLILAVPLGIFGATFASRLLAAMGATPGVLAHAAFTRVVFGFNGVILMIFLVNAVFRGAGDAAIAMRVLWIANAINICLDPCLIFGLGPCPRLGVTGAAVATTTGRAVGIVVQATLLARGTGRIRLTRDHLRLDPPVMLHMVRLSASAVFQGLVTTTSWVGLIRILASFGSAALAGYTIAIRIVIFALLPCWGLSNAAATLVGQNLGAGKPARARASVWRTCAYNVALLGTIGLIYIVLAGPIAAAFTDDAAVVPIATRGLRIVSSGFLFYAVGFVLTQAFNGAGDPMTPTLINLVCFWLLEIPLAYALAGPLGLGPSGVFGAIAVSFSAMAILSVLVFRRGAWASKTV